MDENAIVTIARESKLSMITFIVPKVIKFDQNSRKIDNSSLVFMGKMASQEYSGQFLDSQLGPPTFVAAGVPKKGGQQWPNLWS
jgi:hypothetical protein